MSARLSDLSGATRTVRQFFRQTSYRISFRRVYVPNCLCITPDLPVPKTHNPTNYGLKRDISQCTCVCTYLSAAVCRRCLFDLRTRRCTNGRVPPFLQSMRPDLPPHCQARGRVSFRRFDRLYNSWSDTHSLLFATFSQNPSFVLPPFSDFNLAIYSLN